MHPSTLSFLLQLLWGGLLGALFGARRTLDAAQRLLEKNRALADAGLPAVPGNGHWAEMAGSAPGWAGGLFFALSLGMGFATLAYLWGRFLRKLPREALGIGIAAAALPALLAAHRGETGLALTLASITAGALWLGFSCPPDTRRNWTLWAGALVLLAGMYPWATAPESGFARFRDKALLHTDTGRAVNEFYYRWTFYPAEAIKPFLAYAQPAVAVSPEIPPDAKEKFLKEAARFRALELPWDSNAADFRAVWKKEMLHVEAAGISRPWPSAPKAQEETIKALSTASDRSAMLRKTTAWSLATGAVPALILLAAHGLWALSAAAGKRRGAAFLGLSLVACVFLWNAGTADGNTAAFQALYEGRATPEQTASALASANATERLYGAYAATYAPEAHKEALLKALGDPVPNVRQAAAQALSGVPEARETLVRILEGEESWYLKERAYLGLWRSGWRPR